MKNLQLTINNILNSCIRIDRANINHKLSIPRQIVFRFNPEILSQIEQAKENNYKFTLSPRNLADLRYYVLLNYFLTEQLNFNDRLHRSKLVSIERSPLIFTSSYLFSPNQSKNVVRSIITSEGQISQQIQQDLWQSPQLLPKVIDAHHWLILQILSQLPLKVNNSLAGLLKSLWLITLFLFSICLWIYLPIYILFKILIIGFVICLSTKYFPKAVKKKLKIWILHGLVNGLWSNGTKNHQIVWNTISALS